MKVPNLNIFFIPFQIEEEIEEITEYISDDKDNAGQETSTSSRSVTKSGPWLSSKPSLGNSVDCILAVLNNSSAEEAVGKPTAFPEFGVDIVLHHKHGTILVFYTFYGDFQEIFDHF